MRCSLSMLSVQVHMRNLIAAIPFPVASRLALFCPAFISLYHNYSSLRLVQCLCWPDTFRRGSAKTGHVTVNSRRPQISNQILFFEIQALILIINGTLIPVVH